MAEAVFVAVVLLRFAVPLLIPRYPLPAIIACLVIDAADQTIFQAFTDDPLLGYQSYDKALDVYYLTVAYITGMQTWALPVPFAVLRFLFFYRLVGVTLFELLGWRWLLLAFPNTFEYYFIAYEAIRTMWNPARMSARHVVGLAAAIWIFIKLPQEWWIHIAQNDFTDFMSDYPFMWAVLGAAVVGAATLLWTKRNQIPSTDWPFTLRPVPAPVVDNDRRARILDAVLVEKVVLLALLGVIFAQILPNLQSSDLGIGIGIAILVVLNAAVTEWLRRRGRSWSNTAQQFGAMVVINLAIVVVDNVLGNEGLIPPLRTLFFVLLLSLVIAMFDRARAHRPDLSKGVRLDLSILRAGGIPPARG
jgi:hypothetical protein